MTAPKDEPAGRAAREREARALATDADHALAAELAARSAALLRELREAGRDDDPDELR